MAKQKSGCHEIPLPDPGTELRIHLCEAAARAFLGIELVASGEIASTPIRSPNLHTRPSPTVFIPASAGR